MSEYSQHSYDVEPQVARNELASAAGLSIGIATVASAALLGAAAFSVAALYRAVQKRAAELEANRLKAPEAWLGAITSDPLVLAALERELPELPRLRADATRLNQAFPVIQNAFARSRDRLLVAEAGILHGYVTAALSEMGYTLRVPRRPLIDCALVQGAKPSGTAVAVKLSPKSGRIEFDFSGFHDNACTEERNRLFEALRRRGVRLTDQMRQQHGRLAGGALTAHAHSVVNSAPVPPTSVVTKLHT